MSKIDLSPWLKIGSIALVVARSLRAELAIVRNPRTRRHMAQELRLGFLKFCENKVSATGKQIDDRGFNSELIEEFVVWLNAQLTPKGEPLKVGTKAHRLTVVRAIARQAKHELQRINVVCDAPENPWPKQHQQGLVTEPLTTEEFKTLLTTVAKRTESLMREIGPKIEKIAQTQEEGKGTCAPKSDVECAAYVLERHDGYFPERVELDRKTRDIVDGFGYTNVRSLVFPQANDLIPIILYLACMTGLNQQPLTDLRTTDLSITTILGKERLMVTPIKNRARGAIQRRSFVTTDEFLNPKNVFDFVIKWTDWVRCIAPDRIADRVFLVANKHRKDAPTPVLALGDPFKARTCAFTNALANFTKRELGGFLGLRKIRASFAEQMNQLLNGDLEAVSVLLGHTSLAAGGYRSRAARERDEQALAGAMAMRARLVESAGVVDPRPRTDADRSAATPGWRCLDPYLSPMLGEKEGKLCAAYGQCPGCPLSRRVDEPHVALARALQLRSRMEEAKDELGSVAFHARFGRAYEALVNKEIPKLLTDSAMKAAGRLSLNPLPRLV